MSGPGIRGFACCNELYEQQPVVEGFRAMRSIGYDAVEVAPYTFGHPVFPRALAEAPAARDGEPAPSQAGLGRRGRPNLDTVRHA